MFAGPGQLDNLCAARRSQLRPARRRTTAWCFPMPDLEPVFRSFGWDAPRVDATDYDGVYAALESSGTAREMASRRRSSATAPRVTAAFSDFLNRHKVTVADSLIAQELALQAEQRRDARRGIRSDSSNQLRATPKARPSGYSFRCGCATCIWTSRGSSAGELSLSTVVGPLTFARRRARSASGTTRPPARDRSEQRVQRERHRHAAMKVFARDRRVVSIDADLASTSGLEAVSARSTNAAR